MKEIIELQNANLKSQYSSDTKKLVVFTVPGWNGVNGGVMSISSIARVTRDIFKNDSTCSTIMTTVPKAKFFAKYDGFEAGFDIFRFEQLRDYFTNLEEIILHIPENFVKDFESKISEESLLWLSKIEKVQINILNQNIWYMPEKKVTDKLKKITENVTMTVSHKKFCTKHLRDNYEMSVHLFSTSNLVEYVYKTYDEKEDIILYSPDQQPLKKEIIEELKEEFEDYKFIQIKDMSYAEYREHLSRSKYMLTFGEGIDGYFCESVRCGAIPFTAYNPEFFDDRYTGLENIFEDYKDLKAKVVNQIKYYNENQDEFKKLSDKLIQTDKIVYNDEEYKMNIANFYNEEYTFDYKKILEERNKRVESNPLISIVMATYNGEEYLEEQLESIKNLTYKNIEVIISDDNSTDSTMEILEKFQKDYPCTIVKNTGKNGVNYNFENGLKLVKGEYIALCDQDDIWYPNKLEILLENIDDFDLIHSGVDLIDELGEPHSDKGKVAEYGKDYTSFVYFENFVVAGWVLGCTSLIKRELFKSSPDFVDEMFFHDWWLTIFAIKKGNGIKYVKDKTIQYRQHTNNTAQNAFATTNHYIKKIDFNIFIADYFKDSLTMSESVTIRNNNNYALSKYFLLNDHYGKYDEVDEVLEKYSHLMDRKFLNKLVELVADDVAVGLGAQTIKAGRRKLSDKINQPSSKTDYMLRNLYLDVYVKFFRKHIKK